MTRMTRVLGMTWALVAVATAHMTAQTARVEGGVRSLTGVDFYWETRLVPPVPPLDGGLQMLTLCGTWSGPPGPGCSGSDTVHRVMVDRSRKLYFGYDARVTVIKTESDADTRYSITFRPLSYTAELQRILGPDVKTWTLLPAPRFPAPRVVRGGEVLELTLLTNSTWGQQISEYVTLQEPRRQGFDLEPPREFAFASGAPRDFSAADVELRLQEPRVTRTYPSADIPTVTFKSRGEAAGPILWMYLPGRGRVLLSLTPRNGFRRAGEVRGSTLRFVVDGQTYDVVSTSRIAPATAAFNLYVLPQPDWKPTYANANLDTVHIGSADRLEYLVGRE
jgi:hypothetical protein